MSGGRRRVRATFWLLDAPDSLELQSRAEPDGAGLGTFSRDGKPFRHRTALAAYEDTVFASEARELESTTFVAHVRYASTGAVALQNTHPFEQDGRLFAHNGVVGDLPTLERELGPQRALVKGETDSERVFALITREIDRNGGNVSTAIADAARWIARELPLYALNVVLTPPDGLWALGSSLSGHARPVRTRAPRRRHAPRPPFRGRQRGRPDPRSLARPRSRARCRHRHRAHGRAPRLAQPRIRGASPRR